MNILEKVRAVLLASGAQDPFLGYFPPDPDTCAAIFEYGSVPPEHSFGGTDIVYGVQARCRSPGAQIAFSMASKIEHALNRYHDDEISIVSATPIANIGRDKANPPRQEYTVNFQVRRY